MNLYSRYTTNCAHALMRIPFIHPFITCVPVRWGRGAVFILLHFLFPKEADASFAMMASTYGRHKVVDFGPTLEISELAILSGTAEDRFDAFGFLRAFSLWVKGLHLREPINSI